MRLRAFPGLAVLGILLLLLASCASSDAGDSAVLATNSAGSNGAGSNDTGGDGVDSDRVDSDRVDSDRVDSDRVDSADAAAESSTPTVVASADEVTSVAPAVTTTTTAAPTTTTSTTTTTLAPTAEECASAVPLEMRVGQLMFPLVTQAQLPEAANLAERGLIGGVVVIGNPTAAIQSEIQTLQQRSLLGPVIVAVDEEGGSVQRLAALTSTLPSASAVAAGQTLDEARELARAHAVDIGELGFTMNLAPVVDLDNGGFLGSRTFGSDPNLVTDFAFATADGIIDAGLTPVVKHFPGHGRGTDSHTGLPTLPELDVLRGDDLVPFVRAAERADLPIMIGHLVVPDLTNGKPATLSPEAIDGLLRTELGFDGLVITDAFNMAAIAATTNNADAAEQSIMAGVDLVMLGGLIAVEDTVAQVTAAVEAGTISEDRINESFLRVIDTRELQMCAFPEDIRPNIGCDASSAGC